MSKLIDHKEEADKAFNKSKRLFGKGGLTGVYWILVAIYHRLVLLQE